MSHEYAAVVYVHALRTARRGGGCEGVGSSGPLDGDDGQTTTRVRLGALLVRMGTRLMGSRTELPDLASRLYQQPATAPPGGWDRQGSTGFRRDSDDRVRGRR